MILSILLYGGGILGLVGLLTLAVPVRRLGIPTRRRAALVLVAAVLCVVIGLYVPVSESSVTEAHSRLDELHPRWQFSEYHETLVAAPPAAVYRAIKDTTAGEILLFRTLTYIRRFGRPGPESIMNAPEGQPILDVAVKGGFRILADEPDREVVIAAEVIRGKATATMNFRIEPAGAVTRLTTETRVYAVDPASRRAFQTYWRIIYPGSSIIRYSWLRAIRLRAERQ